VIFIYTEYEIKQLSTRELLSLTLRENPASETLSVLDDYFSNPRELINCSLEELSQVKGIGQKRAMQLKASLELGRRVYNHPAAELPMVKNPDDLASLIMDEMRYLNQEHFRVVLLNRKNNVLSIETITIGGLCSSIVHPRECFKPAIKKSAASIILVHNHPSGDPTPSQEDINITRRLIEVGDLIGITVLDHLIIGDNRWVSLKSLGHM